jgi:hypothetical protein
VMADVVTIVPYARETKTPWLPLLLCGQVPIPRAHKGQW